MSDTKAPALDLNAVKTTGYSWFVAILVALNYAVSFVSRNVWSTAIPVAHESMGITMAAAGGLMTAFYIGYVISNFVTGFVVDRIGPRLTLGLATLFTGVFTILIPWAPGYAAIFALRVAAGFCAGPLFSSVTKYQISYFSPATRSTAMGLMMAGTSLGMVLAASAFAPIIQNQGWQQGFIYAGLVTIFVAVVFYIFGKEQGASAVRSGGKVLTPEQKAEQSAGLKAVLGRKSYIIGCIILLLNLGANMGFTTYIITFFTRVKGLSLVAAGGIVGGTTAIGLFTGTLSGIVADIVKKKKLMCLLGGFFGILGTVLIMLVDSVTGLTVILGGRILLASLAGTPFNALMAESAAGPYVGRAMGIYNGIGQTGSIIFPLIFGAVLDASGMNFQMLFTGVVIVQVVVFFLYFGMEEKKAAMGAQKAA
jgi:MFS family permease